jgi:hypothetical protein
MRIFFNILCPVCQKLFALISPFVDFEEKKYESAGEKQNKIIIAKDVFFCISSAGFNYIIN